MKHWLPVLVVATLAAAAFATPHNTPFIDGHVTTEPYDWDADELAIDDPADDCRYGWDTDLDDVYLTWDSDALYIGFTTDGGPGPYGNELVVFVDTDAQSGITGATDFTSFELCPWHITFSTIGVDMVILGSDTGAWAPIPFVVLHCEDPANTTPIAEFLSFWNPAWRHEEIGISWDGIYGLGPGAIPVGTTVRIVAVVTGGPDAGAFDAAPNTSTGIEADPAVPWNTYTDLDIYFEAVVDGNHDGFPDGGVSPADATTWGRIKRRFSP